jgi:hypothetical protein
MESEFHDDEFKISSFSGGNGGTCIEVALHEDAVAIRDSKDVEKRTLVFTAKDWASFVKGVKAGDFDLS